MVGKPGDDCGSGCVQVTTFREHMDKAKREYLEALFSRSDSSDGLARIAGIHKSHMYSMARAYGVVRNPRVDAPVADIMRFKERMDEARRDYWRPLFASGLPRAQLARAADVHRSFLYRQAEELCVPLKSPSRNAANRGNAAWQSLGH